MQVNTNPFIWGMLLTSIEEYNKLVDGIDFDRDMSPEQTDEAERIVSNVLVWLSSEEVVSVIRQLATI